MKVVVALEARFYRTPDQEVWCDNQFNFAYSFWTRYLEVFDGVKIVARVTDVSQKGVDWKQVTGTGVELAALPAYVGVWQYLKKFLAIKRSLQNAIQPQQAYIFRVASVSANMIYPLVLKAGSAFAVEVVGDPWDIMGPGGVKHPLRPFFRYWLTFKLKRMCLHASAASYVTERLLQNRYPAPRAKVSVAASSIVLTDDAIVTEARSYIAKATWKIITVGSLEQTTKGTDLLISAVAILRQQGLDVRLELLGDGRLRPMFAAQVAKLNLQESIKFLGNVPAGIRVREHVQSADIFVLPSRADGMPRAMIEAMALGLFCIGTQVGGMQELLPSEWLVPINRADLLASKIKQAILHTDVMSAAAQANLQRARGFHHIILAERRHRMYTALKEIAEERAKHG